MDDDAQDQLIQITGYLEGIPAELRFGGSTYVETGAGPLPLAAAYCHLYAMGGREGERAGAAEINVKEATMEKLWDFVHNQAGDAKWTPRPARDFLITVTSASRTAPKATTSPTSSRPTARSRRTRWQQWHIHECTFQFVLVLNGWATFEYEGQGERTIRKGDAILQTPMIKHREIACSEYFEVLEIVAPANFQTKVVDAPESIAAE